MVYNTSGISNSSLDLPNEICAEENYATQVEYTVMCSQKAAIFIYANPTTNDNGNKG